MLISLGLALQVFATKHGWDVQEMSHRQCTETTGFDIHKCNVGAVLFTYRMGPSGMQFCILKAVSLGKGAKCPRECLETAFGYNGFQKEKGNTQGPYGVAATGVSPHSFLHADLLFQSHAQTCLPFGCSPSGLPAFPSPGIKAVISSKQAPPSCGRENGRNLREMLPGGVNKVSG